MDEYTGECDCCGKRAILWPVEHGNRYDCCRECFLVEYAYKPTTDDQAEPTTWPCDHAALRGSGIGKRADTTG